MAYENLLYEKRDRIGFITFNRPKVLNALNRKTMDELNDILINAREDDDVRVLLLTGADSWRTQGADALGLRPMIIPQKAFAEYHKDLAEFGRARIGALWYCR